MSRLHARPRRGDSSRCAGLSYIEVLVATVILVGSLAPAMEALRNGAASTGVQHGEAIRQQRLLARIEEVLAKPFATLDAAALAAGNDSAAPSAYSDPAGAVDRILIVLYRYNGSGHTTTSTGLLRVEASIVGTALTLSTLRTQ